MAHPGIFAILVGFAIGTAIYYYLNSDSPQSHQYSSNENVYGENRYRYSPNNALKYTESCSRRRRRNSNEACVICIESIKFGPTMKLTKCGHEFHSECIEKWLREKKDCPICRSSVI